MKISGRAVAGFLADPPAQVRAVLVFGPDDGLVRERVAALIAAVLDDPKDPFRLVELTGAELKTDPARLADEGAALSMTGGRRVVRVRGATDSVQKAFAALLDQPAGDALVIADAGDLPARSSLRKYLEGLDRAAVLACYPDEGRSLDQVVGASLAAVGLQADPDAKVYLAAHLGSDRLVTRSEIEKLALYMGQDKRVTLEAARSAVGDSGAVSLDALLAALGSGDQKGVDLAVDRVFAEGTAPVGLLRAVNRHFQRLHLAVGYTEQGVPPDQAMKRLRPPVIFKLADAFRTQMRLWSGTRIARTFDLLAEAEAECKTTGLPAETICRRTLMRIAQASRR